jgi:hypothetical protein
VKKLVYNMCLEIVGGEPPQRLPLAMLWMVRDARDRKRSDHDRKRGSEIVRPRTYRLDPFKSLMKLGVQPEWGAPTFGEGRVSAGNLPYLMQAALDWGLRLPDRDRFVLHKYGTMS